MNQKNLTPKPLNRTAAGCTLEHAEKNKVWPLLKGLFSAGWWVVGGGCRVAGGGV